MNHSNNVSNCSACKVVFCHYIIQYFYLGWKLNDFLYIYYATSSLGYYLPGKLTKSEKNIHAVIS